MRFLIVDDDSDKIRLVREFLIGQRVDAADVLSAEHAAGARMLLEQVSVDVLLIDVLLPVRRGGQPHGEHSVELLRQIVEDGTTPSPRHILGMTASPDAIAEFGDDFRRLVTQVLHVAPGEHAWRDSLNALLLLLQRIEDARDANDYDICVLNALRAPELEAVISSWPLTLGAEQILARNILYRQGSVLLNGVERRIACAHLSQMGPIASAHAATAMLAEFRPRVLLMTGICGGFAEHVAIGDIVVAEKSWDWQAGKWSDEGTLATALDQRDPAPELVAEARGLESVLPGLYAEYEGPRPSKPPRLVVGPMVSGSSVVASLDIQKVFRNQHRKMAGVDMECYGIYYAAANHAGAPVRAICVKSVSDLADRAKGDDFQTYCSQMSARVALEMVRRYFSR
ncbi:response regulator [Rubrivivax benzoatilyticus]|uniref:Response regulator n=2 Tax=Rubrivivax benzoatilyticus TaxID=316997 RepID=A0ABX0I3V2_9BURK|nr:response regulator [Rubrivivax benzoatilyticus]NHL26364.1 response regulator [Rubrivivax benzoatilyticus]